MKCDAEKVLTNILPAIWFIWKRKIRQMFEHFVSQFLWRKAHRRYIVHTPLQHFVRRFKIFWERSERVSDVHHWQSCVRFQITIVVTFAKHFVEYCNCVIWKVWSFLLLLSWKVKFYEIHDKSFITYFVAIVVAKLSLYLNNIHVLNVSKCRLE